MRLAALLLASTLQAPLGGPEKKKDGSGLVVERVVVEQFGKAVDDPKSSTSENRWKISDVGTKHVLMDLTGSDDKSGEDAAFPQRSLRGRILIVRQSAKANWTVLVLVTTDDSDKSMSPKVTVVRIGRGRIDTMSIQVASAVDVAVAAHDEGVTVVGQRHEGDCDKLPTMLHHSDDSVDRIGENENKTKPKCLFVAPANLSSPDPISWFNHINYAEATGHVVSLEAATTHSAAIHLDDNRLLVVTAKAQSHMLEGVISSAFSTSGHLFAIHAAIVEPMLTVTHVSPSGYRTHDAVAVSDELAGITDTDFEIPEVSMHFARGIGDSDHFGENTLLWSLWLGFLSFFRPYKPASPGGVILVSVKNVHPTGEVPLAERSATDVGITGAVRRHDAARRSSERPELAPTHLVIGSDMHARPLIDMDAGSLRTVVDAAVMRAGESDHHQVVFSTVTGLVCRVLASDVMAVESLPDDRCYCSEVPHSSGASVKHDVRLLGTPESSLVTVLIPALHSRAFVVDSRQIGVPGVSWRGFDAKGRIDERASGGAMPWRAQRGSMWLHGSVAMSENGVLRSFGVIAGDGDMVVGAMTSWGAVWQALCVADRDGLDTAVRFGEDSLTTNGWSVQSALLSPSEEDKRITVGGTWTLEWDLAASTQVRMGLSADTAGSRVYGSAKPPTAAELLTEASRLAVCSPGDLMRGLVAEQGDGLEQSSELESSNVSVSEGVSV